MKLSESECDEIDAGIRRLEDAANLSPRQAEQIIGAVLNILLRKEGFDVKYTDGRGGIDFHAIRVNEQDSGIKEMMGIEFKFRTSSTPVSLKEVQALVGAAILKEIGRVMLISNREFTPQAHEAVEHNLPLRIELMSIGGLKSWIGRLRDGNEPEKADEVRLILRASSQGFARLIARDPGTLAHLEWRDVERTVAEVFDGLGFRVTLTPSSKDGGKDVILECIVEGKHSEYYVEIKHWRSSTRVGAASVEKLLKVVVQEKKAGALFLSTYGFTNNAFEQLTTIDRQKMRYGGQEKIVTLCQSYMKARAGIWSPPENLSEIIFA